MKKSIFIIIATILTTLIGIAIYQFFPHKRYAIFAGYNRDGRIAPYVITYLENLSEISDGIIYITDSKLFKEEYQKLSHLPIIYQKHNRHNEYDWGSYKRGYLYLKETGLLKNTRQLIFANDSCIAPLTSFKPMFKKMSKQKADFWSNTQGRPLYPHLQSYFLVFNRKAFSSEIFDKLLTSVTHQRRRQDYINKYEILLSTRLKNSGYIAKSFIPVDERTNIYTNPISYITKYDNQFIKLKSLNPREIRLENNSSPKDLLNLIKQKSPQAYQNALPLAK